MSRSCLLVCDRTRFVLCISSCVPRHPWIRSRSTSKTAIKKRENVRATPVRQKSTLPAGVIGCRFSALISRLRVVDFSAARFRKTDWTYTISVYSACISCNLLFTSFCPVGIIDCLRFKWIEETCSSCIVFAIIEEKHAINKWTYLLTYLLTYYNCQTVFNFML